MGEQGARLTGTAVEVGEAIVADLASLGDVRSKKMFGGVGIFGDDVMFVIVDSAGNVFLRVDDGNRDRFEAAGAEKHGRMPYYAVPAAVLNDEAALLEWAGGSLRVAKDAKK